MSTDKITFLLNWRATPYHAPVYLAHSMGYFAEQGLKVALLEPNDPSDVTELIGSGKVDMGLKAMIHTLAAKARGFPIQSIGTLLDEPFTGIIYLKGNGIEADNFKSLRGKRIGYVGEFGKLQIDELTGHNGMRRDEYTAVRCGMHISKALMNGEIDAGIGLENVQMVELAEWLKKQGRPADDVQMLRLDELANLGCCCFCSILYIGNEKFLAENPEKVKKFMLAYKKATDFMLAKPEMAFAELVNNSLPHLGTELQRKIFQRSFVYFSETMQNLQRDWVKVYSTSTKKDHAELIGPDGVHRICSQTEIPTVAIGGINVGNAKEIMEIGRPNGLAVCSAICSAADPEEATNLLVKCIKPMNKNSL